MPEEREVMNPPRSSPKSLGPKKLEPLFNEEQVRKMDEMVRSAPLISQTRSPSPGREPGWDGGMERRGVPAIMPPPVEALMKSGMKPHPMTPQEHAGFGPGLPGFSPGYPSVPQQWMEEQMRRQWQMNSEMSQVGQALKHLQEENLKLRMQLMMQLMEERESRYATPPDGLEAEEKNAAGARDLSKKSRMKEGELKERRTLEETKKKKLVKEKTGGRSMKRIEDGSVDQQEGGKKMLKEKKGPIEEAAEDSFEWLHMKGSQEEEQEEDQRTNQQKRDERHGRSAVPSRASEEWDLFLDRYWGKEPEETMLEEDGSVDQQEKGSRESEGVKDRRKDQEAKEDGSDDRQEEENPEHGRGCARDDQEDESSEGSSSEESEERLKSRKKKGRKEDKGDAFKVMLKLMEGMQHLQRQIIENKSEGSKSRSEVGLEDEPVRGGLDLHPLPEWTQESAPVDLQDWLLVLHPQMADLSSSSQEWWELTLDAATS